MAKRDDGKCSICGHPFGAYTSAYRRQPFVDGRYHQEICWTCACVPKMSEFFESYDDGKEIHKDYLLVYNEFSASRIHTLQEMMEEGFSKEESLRSIKAVKRAAKRYEQKKEKTKKK